MNELSTGILIIDFGSQTTLLIKKRLDELGAYAEVWGCEDERLSGPVDCAGIILSGGPCSVYQDGSPSLPPAASADVPVLGICYGMQLLVHSLGGKVEPNPASREFGRSRLSVVHSRSIIPAHDPEDHVWMSHGDTVVTLPSGWVTLATSWDGKIVTAAHDLIRPRYGVQFHPEVEHTSLGREILSRFLCECKKHAGYEKRSTTRTWGRRGLIADMIEATSLRVGRGTAVCGLSGGVDSAVAATIVSRAIGDRLTCILVDTGMMRKGEVEDVTSSFPLYCPKSELRVVCAHDRFLSALDGVSDPEEKRKVIGRVFIEVFTEEAEKTGADFLVQGTLYPDVIESTSTGGPSSKIKTHHNVGGLPPNMKFTLVEPLRRLFKDDVRRIGRELGVPDRILGRHPFPGPGLAVRVLGEVTEERLSVLREADAIFIEELKSSGLYGSVWQAFAVLLPVKTVGVMGDARTYENALALRAVNSVDGMTADRSYLPMDFLGRVCDRIINEVAGVNRVVYDLTSKPPGTIEWE